MQILTTTVARYMFAIPFGVFGAMHLMNGEAMAGMVPSYLPGTVMVYLTGVALLAVTVSIIIKKMASLSTLLLGAMLVLFVLLLHLPGVMSGDEAKMMASMPMLLKDFALAGAAWTYSGIFKEEGV